MLQRLSEDLEYSELLDRAARCDSSLEQMCLVAAFSVSSYSTTVHRTAKPFNPLLGETYELDRVEEYGYRSISEQVPAADGRLKLTYESDVTCGRDPLGQPPSASCCPPRHFGARVDPVAAHHYRQQVSWEIHFCDALW